MADSLIPCLMIGDCCDTICVRASRLWDFLDPLDETKILHTDLVLIDEEGHAIHAQIYPPLIDSFKPLLKEGAVYNIAYFKVKRANTNYNPVSNSSMINFTRWTIVEEVIEIPPAFPMYTYSLTPIEQVHTFSDQKECYTDAIGIVTSITSVVTFRARGRQSDSLKRTVVIRGASSNTSVNVALWGEQATSFPAEQVYNDGQASPQVIIFVGTIVKKYTDGLCMSGGSPCKWYINPDVPEAKNLMSSARSMHKPVKWIELMTSRQPIVAAEDKKISDIVHLNPFQNKKKEFVVTVTIRKVDKSWYYNSCKNCLHTAIPHGGSYKCIDPQCGTIDTPIQRYKLSVLAGDETGDTEFVLFGRVAQRLIKKSADTLIAANPVGFIPNEITRLLERVFIWNVSFSEYTIQSGNVSFQVNATVAEINTGAVLPMSPAGSQQSSLMPSQDTSSRMHGTPHKGVSFLPSSPMTPQGGKGVAGYKATPDTHDKALLTPEMTSKVVVAPEEFEGSPILKQNDDMADKIQVAANVEADLSAPGDSSTTQTQKSATKKRTRPSPSKKTAKKLFTNEDPGIGTEEGFADSSAEPGVSKNA